MCADAECSWTRKKEFLIGKKFKCPFCGEEYIASYEALRRKIPHCPDCTQVKITTHHSNVTNLLDNVIKVLPEVELKG